MPQSLLITWHIRESKNGQWALFAMVAGVGDLQLTAWVATPQHALELLPLLMTSPPRTEG